MTSRWKLVVLTGLLILAAASVIMAANEQDLENGGVEAFVGWKWLAITVVGFLAVTFWTWSKNVNKSLDRLSQTHTDIEMRVLRIETEHKHNHPERI